MGFLNLIYLNNLSFEQYKYFSCLFFSDTVNTSAATDADSTQTITGQGFGLTLS